MPESSASELVREIDELGSPCAEFLELSAQGDMSKLKDERNGSLVLLTKESIHFNEKMHPAAGLSLRQTSDMLKWLGCRLC